ncbi:MAG: tyrosine-type recombinase/integrase [Microcystaceae cyanobacterium]
MSIFRQRRAVSRVDRIYFGGVANLWITFLNHSQLSTQAVTCPQIRNTTPRESKLLIKGKGKLTKEAITLSSKAVGLIDQWLGMIGDRPGDSPLFCTVDRATFGHRLSGNAIYNIVRDTAKAAGIEKVMSPHRVRHSAITAALDATNGDTRKVQKLSRHKNLNTLMIYDDNRHQHQAEVTGILADLV